MEEPVKILNGKRRERWSFGEECVVIAKKEIENWKLEIILIRISSIGVGVL